MTSEDYLNKYGIVLKQRSYVSGDINESRHQEEQIVLDYEKALKAPVTDQYPIFEERLYLTGNWESQDEQIKHQFGAFNQVSGEFDCAFIQDDKSNNYFIFQLVDGRYLDRGTVEALLNLTDPVSDFNLTTSTITFKSENYYLSC